MENKKMVIIKEILYWKENKMLPEHYCQFLLNLYREGETEADESTYRKVIPFRQMLSSMLLTLFVFLFMLLLLFFQSYSLFVQGAILIGMSAFFYGLTIWLKKRQHLMYHVSLAFASLMLLLTGIWIGSGVGLAHNLFILVLVFVLILWLFSGVILDSSYLMFIALVGLLICYGWFIHPWIHHFSSIWLQHLFWYPIAVLLLTIGIKFMESQYGKSLFFAGIISIIAPVGHSFFLENSMITISTIWFMIELFVAVVILLYTREKWTNQNLK